MDTPSSFRRRFLHCSQPEKHIVVSDETSYQNLKELIHSLCPNEWSEAPSEIPAPNLNIAAAPIPPPPPAARPMPTPPPAPPAPRRTHDPKERRGSQRFDLEFRIILICGSKTFRTTSSNVSRGGMQVKQRIPADMLNQLCRVYIGSQDLKENIEFHCVVIPDPRNPNRVKFENPGAEALKRLSEWVQAHPKLSKRKAA